MNHPFIVALAAIAATIWGIIAFIWATQPARNAPRPMPAIAAPHYAPEPEMIRPIYRPPSDDYQFEQGPQFEQPLGEPQQRSRGGCQRGGCPYAEGSE